MDAVARRSAIRWKRRRRGRAGAGAQKTKWVSELDEGSGAEGGVACGGAGSQVETTNDTTVATMISGTRDSPSASREDS